jgi:glucose-6-phosphate dehydrogenase assembly protein OpcA
MVSPDKILKELSKLWVDLGHEDQDQNSPGEPGSGVLRACAMTLITISDDTEDPTNLGETIAMLIKDHPSRSVLVRIRDKGDQPLDSRVFAQCWMPLGQHRQICCEQIEITACANRLDDVPGVVLPLTVPDLPVILWNRSAKLFDTEAFPAIAAIADKLIMDSSARVDAKGALDLVSRQIGEGRLVADLAWARITRWRETVSQIFVNEECLSALSSYTDARVEFGTEKPRTEALYLAAWLQNGLEKVGNKTKVQLVHADGPPVVGVALGVALSRGSQAWDLTIHSDTKGAVEVHANRLEDRTVFPEATDYLALQEELSITGHDPQFEAALPVALSLVA